MTDVLPERTSATIKTRRGGSSSALRVVIAVVVVVAAVIGYAFLHARSTGGAQTHTLVGSFTANGALPIHGGNGAGVPCRVDGTQVGESVTVTDHSGKEIGLGSLTGGVEDASIENCVFSFTVSVPDTDFYNVQVGTGNPVSFSRSELVSNGWHPGITNAG